MNYDYDYRYDSSSDESTDSTDTFGMQNGSRRHGATPLPDVPGPSRFSWLDAQRLLGHSDPNSISNISMNDLPESDDDSIDDLSTGRMSLSVPVPKRLSAQSWKSNRSVRPIALSQSTSSIPTGRAPSPDVTDIISRTPRPCRSSSSRSTSTPRSYSTSRRRASSPSGLAYDGIMRDRSSGGSADTQWERDMGYLRTPPAEVDNGSDSDSSLDLHTPLPNLMVRHGLLSPNSKLIVKSTSMESLEGEDGLSPRASRISVLSTQSSILKDSRDTPKRRVRHRDGKLLRGGIGLTTGLGWSDSEDEDSPSPLTNRISSLNLKRRASASDDGRHHQTKQWQSTVNSSRMSEGSTPARISIGSTTTGLSSNSSAGSTQSRSRSRTPSSSTSSSYTRPPPVATRGFDKLFQRENLIEEDQLSPEQDDIQDPYISFSASWTVQSLSGRKPIDVDKLLPSLPNPRTGSIRRPTASQVQADRESRKTPSRGSEDSEGRSSLSLSARSTPRTPSRTTTSSSRISGLSGTFGSPSKLVSPRQSGIPASPSLSNMALPPRQIGSLSLSRKPSTNSIESTTSLVRKPSTASMKSTTSLARKPSSASLKSTPSLSRKPSRSKLPGRTPSLPVSAPPVPTRDPSIGTPTRESSNSVRTREGSISAPRALRLPGRTASQTAASPIPGQHAVPVPSPRSPTMRSPGGRPRTGTGMVYKSNGVAL
ncbi:hypothetical protein CYLTODRAFT_426109 [Cylindrobasidium torrendii FP15055 ss-10]|uniref:Uncharacterized protein n=1 Tax=Cylindrobasidium torrendii FP15055 ss-10 TaxID=1314674 RepID=A0A0D7AYZ2_9AGAR|nr:hypothetical protein CYLTODRAFT_426109 [Cylindrobasidium torrendii FP15055 ss-10]